MTAAVQPRVPAGQPGGGQFGPKSWMTETGPLPYADRPSAAELPPPSLGGSAGWRPDPDNPTRTLVPAPRCPHGSFARWAARNCCVPRRTR